MQTLLSGPVGGTMGLVALARMLGRPNLIGVDMGGTSFDVSLVVDGRPDVTTETALEGLPLLMPIVDIHTDRRRRRLARVRGGRRSARRARRAPAPTPGPRATGEAAPSRPSPTRTSSSAAIDPEHVRRRPDEARHRAPPRARRGARRGTSASSRHRLAEGILDVINAKMAQAIRTLTVEQGIEPRDFALVAFGGAGPMHAVFLARGARDRRGRRAPLPRRVLGLGDARDRSPPRLQPLVLRKGCHGRPHGARRDLPLARG